MKFYKLTTQNQTTKDNFRWKTGYWYETSGKGDLCGKGWLHFYHSPELAVLFNPIHANIENPILWQAECKGKSKDDNGIKIGWTEARIIKRIPLPEFTLNQKIAFGILCAKEIYKNEKWNIWANKWLSGEDRTAEAAAAAEAATWAAWAVAEAAEWTAKAAKAAEWTVWAASEAASAAAVAKKAAGKKINFQKIIKKVKLIK